MKVQQYSDEEGNIWEDVKHGLIYGGQDFVIDLKARFLEEKKNLVTPILNPRTMEPMVFDVPHACFPLAVCSDAGWDCRGAQFKEGSSAPIAVSVSIMTPMP